MRPAVHRRWRTATPRRRSRTRRHTPHGRAVTARPGAAAGPDIAGMHASWSPELTGRVRVVGHRADGAVAEVV